MAPPVEYSRAPLVRAGGLRNEPLADLYGIPGVTLDVDLPLDVGLGNFAQGGTHQRGNRLRRLQSEVNLRAVLGRDGAAIPQRHGDRQTKPGQPVLDLGDDTHFLPTIDFM